MLPNIASPPSSSLARWLSILGHPALLMPFAVSYGGFQRNATAGVLFTALVVTVVICLAVMLFSYWQVRRGAWRHVDASIPRERGQLNLFVLVIVWGTVIGLAWAGQPRVVWAGVATGGVLVLAAHLLSPWLKLSQHVAGVVLAGAFLWPSGWGFAVAGFLAPAVGWSRVKLGRHTSPEVVVGFLVGIATGWGYWVCSIA